MSAERPHIFLLDDEERMLELLTSFLEDFDEFHVRSALSAEQALEDLAAEPADVAVVDVRLPGMSGVDFILAAAPRGLCRHFILHTGSTDMSLTKKLEELGLTERDLFFKPVGADQLLERIRELLPKQGE
jgi:DNA-binding NtrC family response regulator